MVYRKIGYYKVKGFLIRCSLGVFIDDVLWKFLIFFIVVIDICYIVN